MDILWREFALLYEAGGNRKEVELPPLKLQYKDFAQWQNHRLNRSHLAEKSHQYWKEKLEGGIPLIELPADFKVNKNDRKAAAYRFVVNKDIKDRLNKLGTNHRTTLFIVMFSIYNILLSHLLRQEEIVCGIINAGRGHNSLENIVGYFVNIIVFKCHVDQEESFDDFLQGMNREVLEAFSHEYPLELVLKELDMKFPEISLSFNMLNMWSADPDLELDEFESYRREDSTDIIFDIEIRAQEYKNGIEILCKYRKSMFRFSTIKHIMQAYIKLLDDLSTEQEQEQEA
jgi:fengycin family lipopeptide synthetase D